MMGEQHGMDQRVEDMRDWPLGTSFSCQSPSGENAWRDGLSVEIADGTLESLGETKEGRPPPNKPTFRKEFIKIASSCATQEGESMRK